MSTPAPTPNCGFTVGGSAGVVRLWLVNDDGNGPGVELWAIPGRFYPLNVGAYELLPSGPNDITFNETENLGGYTQTRLIAGEEPRLPLSAGFFTRDDAELKVENAGSTRTIILAAGDFYAGSISAVLSQAYLFLVIP